MSSCSDRRRTLGEPVVSIHSYFILCRIGIVLVSLNFWFCDLWSLAGEPLLGWTSLVEGVLEGTLEVIGAHIWTTKIFLWFESEVILFWLWFSEFILKDSRSDNFCIKIVHIFVCNTRWVTSLLHSYVNNCVALDWLIEQCQLCLFLTLWIICSWGRDVFFLYFLNVLYCF